MDTNKIRNFCIIAHIDAGKSTLADRFLEITGSIPKNKMRPQLLDQMDLERERGITIKLQPVRMQFNGYTLNLIDTPGHMDFYLEVKRSLEAVEGAILLVDGIKGIQAQTLSNLEIARSLGLKIIPAINKIDLNEVRYREIEAEIKKILPGENIFPISAKFGQGVKELLEAVIELVPAPKGKRDKALETVVFDSSYDSFQGVVNFVRVKNGVLKGRVGVFKPKMTLAKELGPGEIGYFMTGQKEAVESENTAQPLVLASLFASDFDLLKDSIKKLQLNDQAFYAEPTSWPSLGRGFKCGFLGLLHMEIVLERLKREFNIDPIITAPQVSLKNGKEPWVALEIITPREYFNKIIHLLSSLRGKLQKTENLGEDKLVISYNVPLYDIMADFYNKLKSITSGFASMSYRFTTWRKSGLKKIDILVAGEKIDALSRFIPDTKVFLESKKLLKKLKEIIPRESFPVPIQAADGSKIIARETIKALRKDVTAGLYGGDYTRKKKLLVKQRQGKKRMAKLGKINIPSDVFIKAIKY